MTTTTTTSGGLSYLHQTGLPEPAAKVNLRRSQHIIGYIGTTESVDTTQTNHNPG